MSVKISRNHSVFQCRDKMNYISRDLKDSFGISYFQYLRCHNDGSVSMLLNDTDLIEFLWSQPLKIPLVYSSFRQEHKEAHSYWFLWDEELPQYPVSLAKSQFNIFNGITFVRRHHDYYDMIAVAMPNELSNPGSFYLNKLKSIERFILKFDKNERDLINLMHNDKINLPRISRDENYDKICFNNSRYNIKTKNGISYITSQELACVKLLCYDYSYKEIAQTLNLSTRSVETYLARIKTRTDYTLNEIKQLLVSSHNGQTN